MTASEGLRKRRTGFFVQVPRQTIRDRQLSFKARGLLTYLLDMPEGWDVRSEALANEGPDGRDAIRTALKELAEHGYYRLERRRLTDGRMVMGTSISETPVPSWITDSAEYGHKAVTVIQQSDGAFKVKHKDGSLTDDGFEDAVDDEPPTPPGGDDGSSGRSNDDATTVPPAEGSTGAGFSGAGPSGAGSADAGESGAFRENTSTGEPNTGDQTLPSPPADAVVEDATTFDAFWTVYPRKVGKQDARTAWDRAVKGAPSKGRPAVDPAVIVAGAVRLAEDPNLPTGDEARFIPHPATWLHRGGWDDEPLPPRISGRATGGSRYDDSQWEGVEQPQHTDAELDAMFGTTGEASP